MDAGLLIREWRDAAKLTQDDVAAEIGVSPGAVSQWETGRSHPRRAAAIRLDRLFKAHGAILDALGYAEQADEPVTGERRRVFISHNYDETLARAIKRIDDLEAEVERLSQLTQQALIATDDDDEQPPGETDAEQE